MLLQLEAVVPVVQVVHLELEQMELIQVFSTITSTGGGGGGGTPGGGNQ
jgi:hypothetical protein